MKIQGLGFSLIASTLRTITTCLLLALFLSSCTNFWSSAPSEPAPSELPDWKRPADRAEKRELAPKATSVPVEKLETEEEKISDVEVVWAIPDEPIDGFVLRYGEDRESLSDSVRLPLENLEKFDDPEYGFVYRYRIEDVPNSTSMYVSLTAFRGETESAPSAVRQVR